LCIKVILSVRVIHRPLKTPLFFITNLNPV
jgi:hypothetical protein